MKEDFNFIKRAIENERQASREESGGIYPRIDCYQSKHEILEIANRYLSNKKEQHPNRTHQLLCTLFDIEIYPIKRELLTDEKKPIGLIALLYKTFKKNAHLVVRLFLYLFEFSWLVGKLFLIWLAFIEPDSLTISIAVVISIFMIRKIIKNMNYRTFHSKLSGIVSLMSQIRDEIASGIYSPMRMSERLKNLESMGAYVYSIAYSLLEMQDSQSLEG